MFYLRYLRSELLRRRARTVLTVLGLAVGVGLVIAISGLSRGLDNAQKTALDPLSTIGTDLTVTRAAQTSNSGFGGGPGGGGDARDLIQANSSVITDLSKLGKPGTHFVHDFFLPGTQLTFPTSQGAKVKSLAGVAAVSQGLVLVAEHQEGTVPKIVAKIKTGGQTFGIRRRITPPHRGRAGKDAGLPREERRDEHRTPRTRQRRRRGWLRRRRQRRRWRRSRRLRRRPFAKCLPARLQQFRANFTTPQQTLKQVLDPPQTNIKTTPYTIAGVDLTQSDIGARHAHAGDKGRVLQPGRRQGSTSVGLVREPREAEGRLAAHAQRRHVPRRRARLAAARRAERRRLPPARAAPEAREPEGPREHRARARGQELVRRRASSARSRRRSAARRSRARARSPTRSPARSSTRRISRTTSASSSRSSSPARRSSSRRC